MAASVATTARFGKLDSPNRTIEHAAALLGGHRVNGVDLGILVKLVAVSPLNGAAYLVQVAGGSVPVGFL